MRVAVLGFGSMGRRHAWNAARLGHEVGVYDSDPAKVASAGVNVFGSEDEAFGWDSNAMVIATPAKEHGRQFWRACRAGSSVLVEKPLEVSADHFWREGGRLGLAEVGPRVQMVGYNLHFHEGLRNVRRTDVPRVGQPMHARFYLRCDRSTWPGSEYESTLLECSHEIDQAIWFFGMARVVAATATNDGHRWRIGLIHQGTECLTTIEIDDEVKGYERGGEVIGTRGTVRWEWHAPTGRFTSMGEGSGWNHETELVIAPEDTYRLEMQSFLMSVSTQTPARPSYTDGLAVLDIVRWATSMAYGEEKTG